ncbi:MarR family winged helix-turn-helix transcriptional regulator [Telluribacter sp. SYSU D00476]|uniref:MarR family winged helix-turn-helix transcriptional regulator n=1 Tax=Telluribacter sp. SYSU D00476 TaxID=2811430 RepID=UPI001FF114E1|nr:MarR family transcriptional regulator [Telluribacter sp. SYSU D00476]
MVDTSVQIDQTIFYFLDKSIKTYRQFAQRNINEAGLNITIDQWLVLNALAQHPEATQHEIAEAVFKDTASLTRIIDLLVSKGILHRELSTTDRRRFVVTLTEEGKQVLEAVQKVSERNRSQALEGINESDIKAAKHLLAKIINNCQ